MIAGGLANSGQFKKIAALNAATHPEQKFEEGNDPYEEHDFGCCVVPGAKEYEEFRIYWKIDYYADEECDREAEDPVDERSYRVLTVMFAEDY